MFKDMTMVVIKSDKIIIKRALLPWLKNDNTLPVNIIMSKLAPNYQLGFEGISSGCINPSNILA